MARDPMLGTNSKSFDSVINSAMKKLDAFDTRLNASNKVLESYAQEFSRLNKEINNFGKSLGGIKFSKGANNKNFSANNINFGAQARNNKSISRGINRVSNKEAQTLNKTLNNVGKSFSGVGKSAASMGSMLVRSANVAGIAIAALGAVIAHTASATRKATQQTEELNRAILGVGGSSKEIDQRSNDIANLNKDIEHTLEQVKYNLGKTFEPILEGFLKIEKGLLGIISKLPGVSADDKYIQYNESDSNIRWYTSKLEKQYNEPETKSIPVIGDIGASAKQSGFDNKSASNLAIGTYNMAMKEANEYGLEASEVANDLADAWLNGSDAAKRYGVVVDDQVLSGYMVTQGVDIVNTEISDAQKQYYRYLLMEEELSSNNSQAMSKNIQQWKKLGMQIDATKQKLFSFDEVITLSAFNTDIPAVGSLGMYNDEALTGAKSDIGPLAGDLLDTNNGPKIPFIPYMIPKQLPYGEPRYLPYNRQPPLPYGEPRYLPYDRQPPLPYGEPRYLPYNRQPLPYGEPLNNLPKGVDYKILPTIDDSGYNDVDTKLKRLSKPPEGYKILPQLDNGKYNDVLEDLNKLSKPSTKYIATSAEKVSLTKTEAQFALLSRPTTKYIATSTEKVSLAATKAQLALLSKPITVPVYTQYLGGGTGTKMLSSGTGTKMLSGTAKAGSKLATAAKAASLFLAPEVAIPVALTAGLVGYAAKHGDPSKRPAPGSNIMLASGGIGTREINNATLFEDNKKEAVIPLESSAGIDYLANAMKEAGVNNSGNSGDVVVNLTLSGVNIADNEAQWQRVGEKIAEVIEVQKQRRGELSYGSKY